MSKRYSYFAAAIGISVVSAAACTGDDGNSNNTTTTTGTPGPSSSSGAGGTSTSSSGSGAQGGGGQAPAAGTCADPIVLSGATPMHAGDTTGAPDNHMSGFPAFDPDFGFFQCEEPGGADMVHAFTAPASGTVEITMISASTDQGFYVSTGCESRLNDFFCTDLEVAGDPEVGLITVVEGETYFIIVDGFDEATEPTAGPYTLQISDVTPEGTCDNDTDDNGDGIFDCADPSCADDAACSTIHTETCTDAPELDESQLGDTANGTDAFAALHPGTPLCPGGEQALSQAYSYTATVDEVIWLQMLSGTDHGLYVRSSCADATTQERCVDNLPGDEIENLHIHASAGSSHTVFVSEYNGGDGGQDYALDATFLPIDEAEPNNDYTDANAATDETDLVGYLTADDDEDWYTIDATAAGTITAITADIVGGSCSDGHIDTNLEIFDTDGVTMLAENDDFSEDDLCSEVSFDVPAAGTYFVRVTSSPVCAVLPVAAVHRCAAPYTVIIDAP
jgi:hypothetical protein